MTAIGLIGRKRGMTQIFTDAGVAVPVTVIEVEPNRVMRKKSDETDGYTALQVTTGEVKANRVTKPKAGEFKKAGVEAGRLLKEFRLSEDDSSIEVGQALTVEVFSVGDVIDVTSVSKGKGFAGVVKRWNFQMQDATHGNSLSHRAPGSIGQNQTPGRVFKGKKMAGQMGNKQVTVQNLQVAKLDVERNLILIKGGVPGAPGSDVVIRPAVKKQAADKGA